MLGGIDLEISGGEVILLPGASAVEIDFVDILRNPGPDWGTIRVSVNLTVWSAPEVLQVPVSALFRDGDDGRSCRPLGRRTRHQGGDRLSQR